MNPINIPHAVRKSAISINEFQKGTRTSRFPSTTFVEAIQEQTQEVRTLNNMKARKNTSNACVDLFFKIGASRGKDIRNDFYAAYTEDSDVAVRILQWARDVRGGAGERELFRQILLSFEMRNPEYTAKLIAKIPEIGRWDDLLIFKGNFTKTIAFNLIKQALIDNNALCAKWMPRKGKVATELRHFLGWSPKRYRKTLVNLTDVVEQYMCANNWDHIDYEKIPSLASARYKKAFNRHSVNFSEYVEKAVKGEAKVNTGAVYPYDILKGINNKSFNGIELKHIEAQWEQLPNLIGDASIFPMIDTSGSMSWSTVEGSSMTPMDIAVSLGLYMADKNTGPFKDAFLTFDSNPTIKVVSGNILQKVNQIYRAPWGGTTNVIAGIERILQVALSNRVAERDMPKILIIFSDMQFNQCTRFDDSAMQSIRRHYENAGYTVPAIVFWNIKAYDNAPVKFNEQGVALVSGFSPTIVKTILNADFDKFSPENIMLSAVMIDRYNLG